MVRHEPELKIAGLFVFVSFALFVASLTQDGFYIDKADNPRAWSSCFGLLLVGWMAVLDGVWAWLANPALAATWLLMCLRRTRVIALGFGFAALGLSLSFLRHSQILSTKGAAIPESLGTGLAIGCGLPVSPWLSSVVSLRSSFLREQRMIPAIRNASLRRDQRQIILRTEANGVGGDRRSQRQAPGRVLAS